MNEYIVTRLKHAIATLTESDRTVLALRYREQLTSAQAAVVLNTTVSHVERQRTRALVALRRAVRSSTSIMILSDM